MFKFKNPQRQGSMLLKKYGYVELGKFQPSVLHDNAAGSVKGYFCANCKFFTQKDGTLYDAVCSKLKNAEVSLWGCCNAWEYSTISKKAQQTQPEQPDIAQSSKVAGTQSTEPVQKAPEQPVQKAPEQPVQKTPEQPIQKTPEQPVQKAPEQPVQKAPEQPVQKSVQNTEPTPEEEPIENPVNTKRLKEALQKNIKNSVVKLLREELKKYKQSTIDFKKTGKETPKGSVGRELKKEDETKLNTIQDKQDADRKKDGKSGVPTDKEWKRFRNAEEVESPPDSDDIKLVHEKLMKKLDTELEEMRNLAQKIDDKTLCDLVTEVENTHFTNYNENRNRYKFLRLQSSMRPVAARLKSAKDYSDKSALQDIEKLNKLVEKYLRLEVKKKYDTDTERIEDQEKEFSKSIK